MLEAFVNFICAFLLAFAGFYIIKTITQTNSNISKKTLLIITINSIAISLIHFLNYSFISLLLNFIINTVTYKLIFKNTIEESFIGTGILTLLVVLADIISLIIQVNLTTLKDIENNPVIYFISNILVLTMAIAIVLIPAVKEKLKKMYNILINKDLKISSIFITIIILAISAILYNLFLNYKFNLKLISNIIIIISLIAIGIIYTKNKNSYIKLSSEYDSLLSNVQNFEEWIEKEQYVRHEYKNQLAVLYAISNESNVKSKIEEIINQNLNIEAKVVNNLKNLPKGGLKGILYYKTIVAQNKKINTIVDISIKSKGILSKLSEEQINYIAKLIGIYYDNAIEAAYESRKKNILVEIYELKDKLSFIISNTYKKTSIIKENKKGLSSKGAGRGNGLYFAKKILSKNKWIDEKHEIIDNYYVETLTILKKPI